MDDKLKQHVITFLSAARFPKVVDQDFSHQSLYDFLEHNYAVRLVENDAAVRVHALDTRMAWYFGVPDGTQVLEMDSTVIDAFGSTIAFGTTLHAPGSGEITFIVRARKIPPLHRGASSCPRHPGCSYFRSIREKHSTQYGGVLKCYLHFRHATCLGRKAVYSESCSTKRTFTEPEKK